MMLEDLPHATVVTAFNLLWARRVLNSMWSIEEALSYMPNYPGPVAVLFIMYYTTNRGHTESKKLRVD